MIIIKSFINSLYEKNHVNEIRISKRHFCFLITDMTFKSSKVEEVFLNIALFENRLSCLCLFS